MSELFSLDEVNAEDSKRKSDGLMSELVSPTVKQRSKGPGSHKS